jgi:hypothetical protein
MATAGTAEGGYFGFFDDAQATNENPEAVFAERIALLLWRVVSPTLQPRGQRLRQQRYRPLDSRGGFFPA